jgi:hypothetical protein
VVGINAIIVPSVTSYQVCYFCIVVVLGWDLGIDIKRRDSPTNLENFSTMVQLIHVLPKLSTISITVPTRYMNVNFPSFFDNCFNSYPYLP